MNFTRPPKDLPKPLRRRGCEVSTVSENPHKKLPLSTTFAGDGNFTSPPSEGLGEAAGVGGREGLCCNFNQKTFVY